VKARQPRTPVGEGDTDDNGVPIMPRELTLYRFRGDLTDTEWHRRQRAWWREHGIDPADYNAMQPIQQASRRAHADRIGDLPALDRARLRAEGCTAEDPVIAESGGPTAPRA
jgi:hypothetical protein